MGVNVQHCDYNKQLEMMNGEVFFVNDFDPDIHQELIRKLAMTEYKDSTFSLIPSCSCGISNLKDHPELAVGELCDYCKTTIAPQTSRKLRSVLWIRPPEGIVGLLNISFLSILINAYTTGRTKSTIIHWLIDPYYKDFKQENQIAYLESVGIERGINYFINNLDYIMQHLNNDDVFPRTPNAKVKRNLFLKLYNKEKDKFVTQYLPMPDKSFNVIERHNIATYIDKKSLGPYMNIINMVLNFKRMRQKPSIKKTEHITAKILFAFVDYYTHIITQDHNGKKGEWRKHVFGTRVVFSGRNVITSIHEPHDVGEVHYPWSSAVVLLEAHLTNLFLKKGYTPNEIKGRIHRAVSNYDPEIDEMFDYLIQSSPHRTTLSGKPGLMILDNRNPSLTMANVKACYITKIKKDPRDITSGLSVLSLSTENADFDGDEKNKMLVTDMRGACSLIHLRDETTVFDFREPNKLSGGIAIPKQGWAILANWLEEGVY